MIEKRPSRNTRIMILMTAFVAEKSSSVIACREASPISYRRAR
jgi:hypothetical protein